MSLGHPQVVSKTMQHFIRYRLHYCSVQWNIFQPHHIPNPEMISFSSLTTVLDNNLPTFQLDALVLLMVNEAKVWGTSICQRRETHHFMSTAATEKSLQL